MLLHAKLDFAGTRGPSRAVMSLVTALGLLLLVGLVLNFGLAAVGVGRPLSRIPITLGLDAMLAGIVAFRRARVPALTPSHRLTKRRAGRAHPVGGDGGAGDRRSHPAEQRPGRRGDDGHAGPRHADLHPAARAAEEDQRGRHPADDLPAGAGDAVDDVVARLVCHRSRHPARIGGLRAGQPPRQLEPAAAARRLQRLPVDHDPARHAAEGHRDPGRLRLQGALPAAVRDVPAGRLPHRATLRLGGHRAAGDDLLHRLPDLLHRHALPEPAGDRVPVPRCCTSHDRAAQPGPGSRPRLADGVQRRAGAHALLHQLRVRSDPGLRLARREAAAAAQAARGSPPAGRAAAPPGSRDRGGARERRGRHRPLAALVRARHRREQRDRHLARQRRARLGRDRVGQQGIGDELRAVRLAIRDAPAAALAVHPAVGGRHQSRP